MRYTITDQAGQELAGYEHVGRNLTALMVEMRSVSARMKTEPTVATEQDGVVTVCRESDGSLVGVMPLEVFERIQDVGRARDSVGA
ncbi:MAG TPA: hypothetical protein VGK73_15090 [Polyangiaceae bacterium]